MLYADFDLWQIWLVKQFPSFTGHTVYFSQQIKFIVTGLIVQNMYQSSYSWEVEIVIID